MSSPSSHSWDPDYSSKSSLPHSPIPLLRMQLLNEMYYRKDNELTLSIMEDTLNALFHAVVTEGKKVRRGRRSDGEEVISGRDQFSSGVSVQDLRCLYQ